MPWHVVVSPSGMLEITRGGSLRAFFHDTSLNSTRPPRSISPSLASCREVKSYFFFGVVGVAAAAAAAAARQSIQSSDSDCGFLCETCGTAYCWNKSYSPLI